MSTVLIILSFLLYFKIFTWYRHDNYWDIQEGVWKRNQNISYRRCQRHTSKADYVIITRRRDRGIEKYLIFGWNLFLEYNVVVGCWAMGKFFSFKVRIFFYRHILVNGYYIGSTKKNSSNINQRKSINNAKSALFVKILLYNGIFEILP